MNTYPRETVEFQPITVTVDGETATTGVQFSVVTGRNGRPAAWVAPTVLDGRIGVMVTGYAPGQWRVWAKVTSNPEAPVIDCGTFTVT